ncbi:diadenylate cyclase CdaA [candidate division KSB1 bacterium]|nr:diadenylate cyclase CdaA [candidate division KSB1 bacterium]
MNLFTIGFIKVTIFDILDIFVISFLLYKLYFFVKGSRAAQMFIGLVFILILSIVVQMLNMSGMIWIFQSLRTVWLVAFVVLFQPELRRMLTHLGQTRLMRLFVKVSRNKSIGEVVAACMELTKRRYGALIVLVRDTGIKTIINTGLKIQADVSSKLIVSIFTPRSPLHDGAVIIQNDIIEAAKCILPLSQNPKLDPDFGMRHRAGLGLSEESDAVCIIVSEETGNISVAIGGKIKKDLDYDVLRATLNEAFNVQASSPNLNDY